MTSPQSDPATDVGAALARLAEQTAGLQRQTSRLEDVITEHVHILTAMVHEVGDQTTRLTDAKFVTYRTLIDSQAEKVALALEATEKAIGKAETATTKAIDKAEAANDARFASVNEFRQQLNDQARTFMPRTEAVQLAGQATQRIRELTEAAPTMATKLELQAMTDRLSERIAELADRMNRTEGRDTGVKDYRGIIFASLAALISTISVVIIVANFVTK